MFFWGESDRLDWITSRGPFHSALQWLKELDHKRPETFSHTQVREWRMRTEVAQDGEQRTKWWIIFPSKNLEVKKEQPWKFLQLSSFLLFSDASLEVTFYVIYLKIAIYSWIVSRWANVEVFSFLSVVRWQGLHTFPLPTKISHEAPGDFTEK